MFSPNKTNSKTRDNPQRLLVLALALLGLGTAAVQAAGLPPTDWHAVPYSNGVLPDPIGDQQTGISEGDLVGAMVDGVYHSSFYMAFDPEDSETFAGGTLAFRARLGGDKNPDGFNRALFVGFDADLDGSIDIFTGVNNSGSSQYVGIFDPGSDANTGPSTTSIEDPTLTYTQNTSNYRWEPVTEGIDSLPTSSPATDLDGELGTDYFLSFALPFQDLVGQLELMGIDFDALTPTSLVMATSTQGNSLNQDLNAVNGGLGSTLTWEELGGLSDPQPISDSSIGLTHVPEPSALLLLAGAGLVTCAGRRRRETP